MAISSLETWVSMVGGHIGHPCLVLVLVIWMWSLCCSYFQQDLKLKSASNMLWLHSRPSIVCIKTESLGVYLVMLSIDNSYQKHWLIDRVGCLCSLAYVILPITIFFDILAAREIYYPPIIVHDGDALPSQQLIFPIHKLCLRYMYASANLNGWY